jgi:hypothetical protein
VTADTERAYRVRHEDVSAERIDGDVIAVNLVTGAYFSLSGSAADVWTAATSGAPFTIWLQALDTAYGCEISRAEVDAVIASCLEHGLIESVTTDSTVMPLLPADLDRSRWLTPVLEVFTDLQDLILVDPIHDADDLGWPRMNSLDD